jgi:integrase
LTAVLAETIRGKRGDGKHKLRATQLNTSSAGVLGDGHGLYLRTTKSKAATLSRSWIFVYHSNKRRRELGLGSYGAGTAPVSLARAREKAEAARTLLGNGIDPIEAKRRSQRVKTFGEVADSFFEAKSAGWSNANHRRQWERTLTVVCVPTRKLAIDKVTTDDVLAILRPTWTTTPEAAFRVRLRIEAVLDYARSLGLRSGDNPARGKGHINNLLAKQDRTPQHMEALPYVDMPAFWKRLHGVAGKGAAALRLTILTAGRPGEVRGMPCGEVDLEAKVWTVPAVRMKEKRLHRVPLTDEAIVVLQSVRPEKPKPSDLVFPGQKPGRPLSDMTLTAVLRRMNVEVDVHGFRSTFRIPTAVCPFCRVADCVT